MPTLRPRLDPQESGLRDEGTADPLLWLIPLLLSGIGIIMISSSSSPISIARFGSPHALGIKQAVWLLIGIAVMLAVHSIPIALWKNGSGVFWRTHEFVAV